MPQKIKHVIGKPKPGSHIANPGAIEINNYGNLRFTGLAVNSACASLHNVSFKKKGRRQDLPSWLSIGVRRGGLCFIRDRLFGLFPEEK